MLTKKQLETLIKKSTQKKRGAKTEVYAEIDGEIRTIKEWAEMFEVSYFTILKRYHSGKTGRELIQAPPRRAKARR